MNDMNDDVEKTIRLDDAAARLGITREKLFSMCIRKTNEDPVIIAKDADGMPILLDDWRLDPAQVQAYLEREAAEEAKAAAAEGPPH